MPNEINRFITKSNLQCRSLWKAWEHAQENRQGVKNRLAQLWTDRIGAAAEELGVPGYFPFAHGLARSNIALDKKVCQFENLIRTI